MVDDLLSWLIAHPLRWVALLAALSVGIGLLLTPRLHTLTGGNHPRC